MRHKQAVVPMVLFLALLGSCTKRETAATGPHATLSLRDGTAYTGTVIASSPTEVTVAGDDKTTRTFQMKDVKSIDYDTPAPQTAAAPPPPSQAGPSSPPAAGPSSQAEPPASPPYHPASSFELFPGTEMVIRTGEAIDSARAVEDQTFDATVARDVLDSSGAVVVPRGANAHLVIRSASRGGRFRGTSDLVVDLQSVLVDGRRYEIEAAGVERRGKQGIGKNKRTAEYTGGGALIGAIIGAIAGHGKGAAIGALSGAAAGAATQVLTRGRTIRIPAETLLTFRLDQPLLVVAAQ